MRIDFPKEALAQKWDNFDWQAAEHKLEKYQEELSWLTKEKRWKEVEVLQQKLVTDTDIKCLAVRHVSASTMSPGVDGVKWKTSAEKMAAAFSLTANGYHASPLRMILITAKNTGKERRPAIPTYYDRAMNVLYGYSLIPVTEAMAERKSFAFRPGRSTQDAHTFVIDAIRRPDAPEYVVCGDIKAYYAHIQHDWLLANVPMDKKVLAELLSSGIIFAGELFPSEGFGISEGSNLSPYLGNFVLDGLQRHIYRGIHGVADNYDYYNGNLIRFADDILITVRTRETAKLVLELLKDFLAERGLFLSEEKTSIRNVSEGFTFLSRTYTKKNGVVYTEPSMQAVERFIDELATVVERNRKSQRDLIKLLNRKLKGWANYHRCTEAMVAFRRIDTALQTILLEEAIRKHPKLTVDKIVAKYWYTAADGSHVYALPDDKSVRLYRLQDTLLLTPRKMWVNANPFIDKDYMEKRTHDRAIQNVTGQYRSIWDRQEGRCYYCGRKILPDQERAVVTIDMNKPLSIGNIAYIHKICEDNEFEIVETMKDHILHRPYNVMRALEEIAEYRPRVRAKSEIDHRWKYYKLKDYLAKCTASSVTLTFKDIEKIIGKPLPATARKNHAWWYPRDEIRMIADSWITEDYYLQHLSMQKEKLTLHRKEEGISKLVIPKVLLEGKLPDNAVFELETHMEYIIKKYGLKKMR